MVGQWVVRLGNTDLVVAARASFPSQLESSHSSDIGLERQHLQVKHQPGMVPVSSRYTNRPLEVRRRILSRTRLGNLNAALHFPHAVEILIHLRAVSRAQLALKARNIASHPIQQAGLLFEGLASFLGTAPLAEQPLKNLPGVSLIGYSSSCIG